MSRRLSIAVTADLHWGHRRGADATRQLVAFLHARPPDVLILAGDLGTGTHFEDCLRPFADLPGRKALVPGNHDLWVGTDVPLFSAEVPPRPGLRDSLRLYREDLPAAAARQGFHYLDAGPLLLPDADLALVGTVNWYDYSWALDGIRRHYPAEEGRLQTKRFSHGCHNDANFVRWPLDDVRFTAQVVSAFEAQLRASLRQAAQAIVVAHHPPFYGLSFPRPGPPVSLDSFLWDAFAGNRALEEVLSRHADRIAFAFCGHTHRERENTLEGIRGYNVGGDYHFKRLLWLEWPAGTVEAHPFGAASEG